jgi:hypothetical protein
MSLKQQRKAEKNREHMSKKSKTTNILIAKDQLLFTPLPKKGPTVRCSAQQWIVETDWTEN